MELTIKKIENILRNEDVEGLLEAGAPNDEYSSEARVIWARVQANNSTLHTEQLLYAELLLIWTKAFDLRKKEIELRKPALLRLAKRILE